MTRRIATLQTLVRWRSLGERRAAEGHRQRCRDEALAASEHAANLEEATALQASRMALIGGGLLDLDRVEWIARYEQAAWTGVEHADALLEVAKAETIQACAAHALARNQQRVADEALANAQRTAADANEKRIFDQMVDLRTGEFA